MTNALTRIWNYRDFIASHVRRDFSARYQRSLLGGVWGVIQPLSMIIIYIVVFSQLMSAKLPGMDNDIFAYGIYLCAGIIIWNYFNEVLLGCQGMFLEHAGIIKKIAMPHLCLPVIVVLNAMINFVLILLTFIVVLLVTGNMPSMQVLYLPLLLIVTTLFALGLGLILGVVNVFFRDVGHLTGITLQFWFWLTPIVYPPSILPQSIQSLLNLNPLYPIVRFSQDIFLEGISPDFVSLIYPLCASMVLCLLAYKLYRRERHQLVDEL